MTPKDRATLLYFKHDELCGLLREDWFVEEVAAVITTAIDEALADLDQWCGRSSFASIVQYEIRRRRRALKVAANPTPSGTEEK